MLLPVIFHSFQENTNKIDLYLKNQKYSKVTQNKIDSPNSAINIEVIYSFFLLNYKSLHFRPSSQHPPTPPTPSPPPSPSLRAVRVSCPVGSSSSSPLPPGPGR